MKSITNQYLALIIAAILFTAAVFPGAVLADGWYDGGYSEGMYGGGYDGGWYDGGYSQDIYGGGYDGGWYDGGYNESTTGGGYDGWYDGGYTDSVTGGGYDGWYDAGSNDWYDAGYASDSWYDAGTNNWYDAGYASDGWYDAGYKYYDSSCGCYSYSTPSYSSGTRSYSTPTYSSSGYSMVKPVSFGSPSYPVTTHTPTRTTGGSSNSYVSNVANTNTTITNVDNSINDSFNNYNSGNVYTAPLSYATPLYPVVYTQPAPYCQIYQASSASGSGVTAVYLSWTSSNATSAYLSNVGGVAVTGSKTVWPTSGMTYTLTVYGYNGQSATCQTTVNAYSAPYVSLTQIPYTGFDFGTVGNAMYWAGLVIFALGAGYLSVYYVPALALAGARTRQYAPVVAAKAPVLVEKEIAAAAVAPVVAAIRKAGTTDTMAIVDSKDGSMPKIVITRD